MKRLSKISRLLVAVLAAGLIAGVAGGPANAGTLEWTDPADDAKDFGNAKNTPLPSDPSVDVTKVTMASDAKNLTWAIHINKLAEAPSIAPGYFFRFNFDYSGQGFAFRIAKDPQGEVVQFRSQTDLVGFNLPCDKCEAKYDLAANKIVLTVPIASMAAGMAASDVTESCPGCREIPPGDPLPPLKAGAEFSGLEVIAQYYYVRTTQTADIATAPDGSLFVL